MENNRISLTPTVARQTPTTSFGDTLKGALSAAGRLSGSILGAIPGAGIISTAITNVTSLAQGSGGSGVAKASSAVVTVGGGTLGGTSTPGGTGGSVSTQVADSSGDVSPGLDGMLAQMRAESDRSIAMQMNMQSESREYNALSNVLKVRHDSAKSAINNLR